MTHWIMKDTELYGRLTTTLGVYFQDDPSGLRDTITGLATLQDAIQVKEMTRMLVACGKAPSTFPLLIRPFSRMGWIMGGGSFLGLNDDHFVTYSIQEYFPAPVPRGQAVPATDSEPVLHSNAVRKQSQRHMEQLLQLLYDDHNETLPTNARLTPPTVRPPDQPPLPGAADDDAVEDEDDNVDLEGDDFDHEGVLGSGGLAKLSCLEGHGSTPARRLFHRSLMLTALRTKYRPHDIRRIRGRHCRWEGVVVVEIIPDWSTETKKAYPQLTFEVGALLAQHIRAAGIGAEDLLWPGRNGNMMSRKAAGNQFKLAGREIGVPGLTSNGLRSAVMTLQGLRGRGGGTSNNHSARETDWEYFRVAEEEDLLASQCHTEGVPALLGPACCRSCGSLDGVTRGGFCYGCRPDQGMEPADAEASRNEALIDLAARIKRRLPPLPTTRTVTVRR